jgi:hypothetical protein
MPEALKQFLERLSTFQAEEIHKYLDSNEDALSDMLETLTEVIG